MFTSGASLLTTESSSREHERPAERERRRAEGNGQHHLPRSMFIGLRARRGTAAMTRSESSRKGRGRCEATCCTLAHHRCLQSSSQTPNRPAWGKKPQGTPRGATTAGRYQRRPRRTICRHRSPRWIRPKRELSTLRSVDETECEGKERLQDTSARGPGKPDNRGLRGVEA